MYRSEPKAIQRTTGKSGGPYRNRVFFACGACHVLAYAFLERHGSPEMKAFWLKPDQGFSGSHIFVATDAWAFDYHGYSEPKRLLDHARERARRWWPGWEATLIELPPDVLISEALSRTYDGLWLREPGQFLHDAMPRARAYLNRFPPPPASSNIAAVSGRAKPVRPASPANQP